MHRRLIRECCHLTHRLVTTSTLAATTCTSAASMAAAPAATGGLFSSSRAAAASRPTAVLAAAAAGERRPPRRRSGAKEARSRSGLSVRPQNRGAASAPVRQVEEEEEEAAAFAAPQGPSTFRRPPRSAAAAPRQRPGRAASQSPPASSTPSTSSRRDSDRFNKPPALPKAVWAILDTLQAAGHPTYLVGGAVRDTLLGRRPKDFDILTTAPPAVLTRLFARARVVGARYPITHILAGAGVHERRAAVATLNSGAWPADPAAREAALAAALAASASARDFTVNALFLDAGSGALLDPTGRGVPDLASRTLTTVDPDPAAAFTADPARMLRAIRLAARTGLRLAPGDVAALRARAGAVATLPSGRLAQELSAMLAHGSAARAVGLAREWGVLPHLLPAHAALLDRECGPVTEAGAADVEGEEGSEGGWAAEDDGDDDDSQSTRRLRTPARVEGMAALVGLDSCTLPDRPAPPGVVAAALAMPLLADEVRRWRPGQDGDDDDGGGGGGGGDDGGTETESEDEERHGGPSSPPSSLPVDAAADVEFARLVRRAMAALCTPVPCGDAPGGGGGGGGRGGQRVCLISKSAVAAGARMIRSAAAPAADWVAGALPLSIVAGSVNRSGGGAGRPRGPPLLRTALSKQSALARNQNVFLIGRRLALRVREAVAAAAAAAAEENEGGRKT